MTKKILLYILSAIVLILSFFSWRSIDQAINVPGSSVWIAPMLWFVLFFAFLSLSIVLIREAHYLAFLFVLCLSLSFIFTQSIGHLLAFVLGFILLFLASHRIRSDLKLNIKINLWRSMRTGRALILIGLAIMITSQYYFEAINLGAKKMIPQFKIDDFSGKATSRILSQINPNFAILEEEGLTVDELLLQVSKQNQPQDINSQMDEIIEREYGYLSPSEKEKIKKDATGGLKEGLLGNEEIILQEGRKQLAKYAGHELTGQEKVSDVFSEIVNNKIDEFFQPGIASPESSSAVPLVIAIFLFLTIISSGPILGSLGMLIVIIAFIILVKFKVVSIKKEMKEVEIIE